MKECCKTDLEEKPSPWLKWLTRALYAIIVIILAFDMAQINMNNQIKTL